MKTKTCYCCNNKATHMAFDEKGNDLYKCVDCVTSKELSKQDGLLWHPVYDASYGGDIEYPIGYNYSFNAIGIIEPATRIYVPDRSKFKSWEDVIDYLIATGIKIEVRDGVSVQGVDVETIKKYSK